MEQAVPSSDLPKEPPTMQKQPRPPAQATPDPRPTSSPEADNGPPEVSIDQVSEAGWASLAKDAATLSEALTDLRAGDSLLEEERWQYGLRMLLQIQPSIFRCHSTLQRLRFDGRIRSQGDRDLSYRFNAVCRLKTGLHGLTAEFNIRNPGNDGELAPRDWVRAFSPCSILDVQQAARMLQQSIPAGPPDGASCRRKTQGTSARKAVRDPKLEARDEWIYQQCLEGVSHGKIATQLKKKAPTEGWRTVSTKQRIEQIGKEYAKRHGKPLPPPRQGL
jgi:hypothetical protein